MTHFPLFRLLRSTWLCDVYLIRGWHIGLARSRYGNRLFLGALVVSVVRF